MSAHARCTATSTSAAAADRLSAVGLLPRSFSRCRFEVMCCLTTSVARLLATSPAACPPMPSATTYRPSDTSTSIASSLCCRLRPTSVSPKASVVKATANTPVCDCRRLRTLCRPLETWQGSGSHPNREHPDKAACRVERQLHLSKAQPDAVLQEDGLARGEPNPAEP